jgi:energy-coupling factor transporter ATP-binding protein EcfA2
VTAVDDLTLAIPNGSCFALLGPNGAGKTTAINVLAGGLVPSAGEASLGGLHRSAPLTRVFELTGFCPQLKGLWESLTLRQHLQLILRLKGLSGAERPTLALALNRALTLHLILALTPNQAPSCARRWSAWRWATACRSTRTSAPRSSRAARSASSAPRWRSAAARPRVESGPPPRAPPPGLRARPPWGLLAASRRALHHARAPPALLPRSSHAPPTLLPQARPPWSSWTSPPRAWTWARAASSGTASARRRGGGASLLTTH